MAKKNGTQETKKPAMMRQGDILLIPVETAAEGTQIACKPDPNLGVVLAVGSATGHTHRFPVPADVELFNLEGKDDRVLVVKKTTKLVHDQHKELEVAAGVYTVRQQRVFTAQGASSVED